MTTHLNVAHKANYLTLIMSCSHMQTQWQGMVTLACCFEADAYLS